MLIHKAKLPYQGLTIVLSNPSRFDKTELLSGNAGMWFNEACLRPELNRWQCDIFDLESFRVLKYQLRPETKVVLCLGEQAQKELGGVDTSLGEQRGSPIVKNGIVYISSYLPQDCFDMKNYESYLNPHLASAVDDDGVIVGGDTEDEDDYGEKSRHGRTNRKNFRFWLRRDTKKCIRILREGLIQHEQPEFKIYPNSEEVIEELRRYEQQELFLDIETDSNLNITCFGFKFGTSNTVYVVPLLRYNYTTAYSNVGSILRALSFAMHKNTTVAHNGAGFDFFVFPYKYRIPIGRSLCDTMIAHHRCFPEVEKSLGHAISNFTDLPYHKDEGIFEPQNETQEEALWLYNAKDVWSMQEVKKGIEKYAEGVRGLQESIAQANNSIFPYLITTFQGIRIRRDKIQEILRLNDRKLTQCLRVIEVALGRDLLREIKGKSQSSLPSSPQQCVKYFHDICGYPVLSRSAKTGKPKLDEKTFLKLALKVKNPMIDLILLYRGIAKESSSLKFNEWSVCENLQTKQITPQ